MFAIDHLAVCGIRNGILAIHLLRLTLDCIEEFIVHALVYQQIVGGNAGLPHVEPLAERDAARRHLDVGRRIDDARALSAEFECDGRKVAARALHNKLSHVHASGKEDFVPTLFKQRGVLHATAFDHLDQAWIESLLTDLTQHRA